MGKRRCYLKRIFPILGMAFRNANCKFHKIKRMTPSFRCGNDFSDPNYFRCEFDAALLPQFFLGPSFVLYWVLLAGLMGLAGGGE